MGGDFTHSLVIKGMICQHFLSPPLTSNPHCCLAPISGAKIEVTFLGFLLERAGAYGWLTRLGHGKSGAREWGGLGLRSVTAQPFSLLLFHSTLTHSLPNSPTRGGDLDEFLLSFPQKADPVSESGKVLIMCVV